MREMKDSGIKWLGIVPVSWNVVPLKSITNCFGRIGFRGYTTEDLVDEGEGAITLSPTNIIDGKISLEKCSHLSWEKYYESPEIMVYRNDILFVKTASVGKCAIYTSDEVATVNPQFVVFKDIKCEYRFLFYCLISDVIQHQLYMNNMGGVIATITQKDLLSYKIGLPDSEEQKRIADYLDSKCSQIDTIIAKQEAIIEKLKEYKLSVITEAVTKGLNPGVEMRDSGIEWVGQVPNTWEPVRLASICDRSITYGIVKMGDYDENGVKALRCSDVLEGYIEQQNIRTVSRELSNEYKRTILKGGEVVINVRGTLGGCAVVPDAMAGYNIAREVAMVAVAYANPRFVMYNLLSGAFKRYQDYSLRGVIYVGLNINLLNKYMICMPQRAEQEAIVAYLDKKCQEIEASITCRKAIIEKLQSYKKALIYEVVTGKKEVS